MAALTRDGAGHSQLQFFCRESVESKLTPSLLFNVRSWSYRPRHWPIVGLYRMTFIPMCLFKICQHLNDWPSSICVLTLKFLRESFENLTTFKCVICFNLKDQEISSV